MSPAGIVMFYGSNDSQTAVAEIDDDPALGIAVGTFSISREVEVLDLTRLPDRIPFFKQEPETQEYAYDRHGISFLHNFVESLAAKVAPGAREHIDYVPTQVVTEWFRTVFRNGDSRIKGIYYPSTQRPGGRSIVLFANRYAVVPSARQMKKLAQSSSISDALLRLRYQKSVAEARAKTLHPPTTTPDTVTKTLHIFCFSGVLRFSPHFSIYNVIGKTRRRDRPKNGR